jgi:CheY-like chemotaxis protein
MWMPEQQRQVVIVEHDTGMREAIERLLRAAGYRTQAFDSAEALFRTEAADHAACLVLDVRLPGLSDFDLRAWLAERGAALPVVFITAHDEPVARDAAGRAAAQKPWRICSSPSREESCSMPWHERLPHDRRNELDELWIPRTTEILNSAD